MSYIKEQGCHCGLLNMQSTQRENVPDLWPSMHGRLLSLEVVLKIGGESSHFFSTSLTGCPAHLSNTSHLPHSRFTCLPCPTWLSGGCTYLLCARLTHVSLNHSFCPTSKFICLARLPWSSVKHLLNLIKYIPGLTDHMLTPEFGLGQPAPWGSYIEIVLMKSVPL